MKCIIPCAGESSRMSLVPKQLVRIGNKPLLLHTISQWKDSVDSFIFILARSSAYLWEYLPENSTVVFQDTPRGLADAILQAERCINESFIINLSDCLYRGEFEDSPPKLGVGAWKTNNLRELNKSYLVREYNGCISEVVEKPDLKDSNVTLNCGMGIYFMDPRVFDYIHKLLPNLSPGGGDFTEVLQGMIDAGEKLSPAWFKGEYINVTGPEDLTIAEEMLKQSNVIRGDQT